MIYRFSNSCTMMLCEVVFSAYSCCRSSLGIHIYVVNMPPVFQDMRRERSRIFLNLFYRVRDAVILGSSSEFSDHTFGGISELSSFSSGNLCCVVSERLTLLRCD